MFSFFKKKEKISKEQQFFNILDEQPIDYHKAFRLFIESVGEIMDSASDFGMVDQNRSRFYMRIFNTYKGIEWFTKSCIDYFESIQAINDVKSEGERLDAYLSAYWFFLQYDADAVSTLTMALERKIPAVVRRYYEKTFNIDIYTGKVYDVEIEAKNAYKEHFYRASYAYNQGKGDLDLSMQEWRHFLIDLAATIESRPRAIYDFAREVCEHQKLFMFIVFAVKTERFNKLKNAEIYAEGGALDTIIKKIMNAIYATNEDYGLFLKRYYA